MQKIEKAEQFQMIIASDKPTVMVFKASWCKDCHYIEPFMPEVVEAYSDKLDFYEIDRDELPTLCEQYHILGIPSFVAFRNGKEVIRFVSKLRKTREEIEVFLDRVIAVASSL